MTEEFPDIVYEMPNLDIPNPPPGLTYPDFEDFHNREILKANGIGLSEQELLTVVSEKTAILQAAAVHTLGSLGNPAIISVLKPLLTDLDDYVQVEAAYAMLRLGAAEGRDTLLHCLDYPIDAYPSPPLAAGYLAKAGDPRGYPVIQKALGSELAVTRISACKQFYFFICFQGAADGMGNTVDTLALFDQALHDTNVDVQWQALVQLREITAPGYAAIVKAYAEQAREPMLRDEALTTLKALVHSKSL